jgi:hypothetical protein
LVNASSRPFSLGLTDFGKPLADLESRPSVGLVVELESEPGLERIDILPAADRDVHDALEQLAVRDVGEVDVDRQWVRSPEGRLPVDSGRSPVTVSAMVSA